MAKEQKGLTGTGPKAVAASKTDLIKVTSEPHELGCPLTAEERAQSADRLAGTIQDLEALEDEKKAEMADLNTRKKSLTKSLRVLTRHVKDGVAMRSVSCDLVLNQTKQTATLIRKDTREEVFVRPLTEEERQLPLDFDDGSDEG